jgi:hypothetical protein
MKTSSYVFKYDKNKNLCNYIEKDSKNNIKSYYAYNYRTNSMVKYDSVNKLRILNQFGVPCKLVHRMEAGESWVRAVEFNSDAFAHTFPKIKKQFALNSDNQIVKFSIQHQLLEQWK